MPARAFPTHYPAVPPRVIRAVLLFSALALAAGAARGAELSITRVFTGWRDAASFKRVSEYFTGRENTGGQIVLRTDPAERAGYYFLIRTRQDEALAATIRLTYFTPDGAEARVVTFPVQLPPRTAAVNVGLTGAAWPDPDASAVAWKVDILSADGATVLASEKSYLWDQPAAK